MPGGYKYKSSCRKQKEIKQGNKETLKHINQSLFLQTNKAFMQSGSGNTLTREVDEQKHDENDADAEATSVAIYEEEKLADLM